MHPVEVLLVPLGRALRRRRSDESASISHAPALATEGRMALTSSSFADGDVIPAKHCGWLIGEEVSPALAWSAAPEGTEQLLLVFEDIDVPRSAPADHTIALLPATIDGLGEGALSSPVGDVRFLPTLFGRARYVGPRPIPGHGPHRYRFHLYALDATVGAEVSTVDQLLAAVDGHVRAVGTLSGTREA
jgi:phosphatidylethanolamine-binding protein (PEBP) family uncharacterized protein